MRIAMVALLISLICASSLGAQSLKPGALSLKPGDRAPEFKIGDLIKGDAITKFKTGHVYVIDCWATWCGPCIRMIPHMTKVQKFYKDKNVHVIGVAVWERDRKLVKPFVKGQGSAMDYTVAMDTPDGFISKHWMKAANRRSIPTVFIVDQKGVMVWVGHPKAMDRVLAEVVAGTYSPEGDILHQKFIQLIRSKKHKEAMALAKKAVAGPWQNDYQKLNEIAWMIVDPSGSAKKRDLDLAMTAAVRADKITQSKDPAILDTLARCFAWKGDYKKALALQKKAVKLAPKDMKPQLLPALQEYQKKVGS